MSGKIYYGETPITDKSSYIIEVDGVDYEVVPVDIAKHLEYNMRSYRDQVEAVEAWNEAEEGDKPDWENYDRAMELLHNRHSKFDLARLIADLLSGKKPKVLK